MNEITLRPYQRETLDRLHSNYEQGIRRNLCVLFTGAGKTILATEFSQEFSDQIVQLSDELESDRTLFLVNRKELAYQAKEAFLESNPSLNVQIEMADRKVDKKADIVVASVQSIGRKGSKRIEKFDEESFDLVYVDEAHFSITDSYIRVLNYLGVGPDNFDNDKMLVGWTATPNRTDGRGLGKIYDEIAVNYDLRYGIKNGWATDLDVRTIKTNTDISDVKAYADEFNLTELSAKLNNPERNIQILKTYKKYCKEEQGIFYTASVEHAHTLTELFNEHGVPSACIEANTDDDVRDQAVRDYKAGKLKVLFNYGTLTYGFNAPETSVIGMTRPVKSQLLLLQIIGRGVRPSELCFIDAWKDAKTRRERINNSVKPTCKILDFHDIIGDHSIVSVPSLFGLNDNLDFSEKEGQKFFQEVVEPLEELKREKSIDISKIKNLDEVDVLAEKKDLNFQDLEVPEEIERHSSRRWFNVGEDEYEIIYPEDKKALVVQKNTLDKWEVIEHDNKEGMAYKLNDFYDLSAAVKLADEYATENYNTSFADTREEWESNGVSEKQYRLLRQLYKGGVRKDYYGKCYDDTGVPVLYYRKTGDRLDAGLASDLIGNKLSK